MKILILFFTQLLVVKVLSARSCSNGYRSFAGKVDSFYFESPCDKLSRQNAKLHCSKHGGWLGEFKSQTLVDGFKSLANAAKAWTYYYSGLELENSVWTWDKENVAISDSDFSNWGTLPDDQGNRNGQAPRNCMAHGAGGTWFKWNCNTKERFSCQYKSCGSLTQCIASREYCTTSSIEPRERYCRCSDGYYGVGCNDGYCQAFENPCRNEGLCVTNHTNRPHFYNCNCQPGYYGKICQDDYCKTYPKTCMNRGTCTFSKQSPFFNCRCPSGFHGDRCQLGFCEQNTDTCRNGGNCTSVYSETEYECKCQPGFYGRKCGIRFCENEKRAGRQPCGNGGNCTSTLSSPSFHKCNCADGYFGKQCTQGYCEAKPNPCKNEATCFSNLGKIPYYSCSCREGFYGSNCTITEFVPIPEMKNRDSRSSTKRTISIKLGDLKSIISCLFVVVYEGNANTFPKTVEEMRSLSFNAETSQNGYVALALAYNATSTKVTVELGDNKDTECNIFSKTLPNQKPSARLMPQNWTIKAQNRPLDSEGINYTVLIMSTIAINKSYAKLIWSNSTTFFHVSRAPSTNDFNPIPVIIAIVAVLVITLLIVVFILFRRRQNLKKDSQVAEHLTLTDRDSQERTITDSRTIQSYNADQIAPADENGKTYENLIVATNTKVRFVDLKGYFLTLQGDHLKNQFEEVKQAAKTNIPQTTFAKKDMFKGKNRYKNTLPYDETRVVLSGEGAESYINACHVKGNKKIFIAAQGPMKNTIGDFWRMISEQGSRIIVMLTRCEESGRRKCEKYWPDLNKAVTHGSLTIKNISEEEFGGIRKRKFEISFEGQTKTVVSHYQYLRWPDHGVPLSTTAFFSLHRQVIEEHRSHNMNTPIVVHCSAGVGRTGTFIGFDILLDESTDGVDVYSCILKMREQRVDMVQTSDQYLLLHRLMLEDYLFGDTDLKERELQATRNKINYVKEFDNLKEADSLNSNSLSKENNRRVLIMMEPGEEDIRTIDANFVESCVHCMNFIASSNPVKSSVDNFLRAIFDNQVEAIVTLNSEASLGERYWPTKTNMPLVYDTITVELINEKFIRETVERSLKFTKNRSSQKVIKQYHLKNWSSDSNDDIIDIMRQLERLLVKQGNVLVHCKNGLGKTGIFIAVMNIINRIRMEGRVDVFRSVKDMRDLRPGMITTLAEYRKIYELVFAFLSEQDIYQNAPAKRGEYSPESIYQN